MRFAQFLAALPVLVGLATWPIPAQAQGGVAPSFNPDLALILDAAAAWFDQEDPYQSGGHDPTRTGFSLQQLELSLGAAADPYFRLDANLVFSLTGVEVEEAYGTTLALPARLQVRAGQLLHRFGRINATHPHAWDFADQPFPIGRVLGGEGNRGLGAELSWLAPLPWSVELVAATTHIEGEATARTWSDAAGLAVRGPQDLQVVGSLKQFFPLGADGSVAWGLSWAGGPSATGRGNRAEVYGTDLYVKWRPISRGGGGYVGLHSEWLLRRRQVPDDVWTDLNAFSQLVWRLDRRWAVAGRHELGTPARGLDGAVVDDPLDPGWTGLRQGITGAVTFFPTEFSRLRLQGGADLPSWEPDVHWNALLALELNIGAHGAHAF